jgi:hypothetical protein
MPASQKPRLRTPTVAASCDDVRRQLVFEPGELVAQQELAFLQSLQLQLVGLTGPAQRLDRRVEIAMLLAQSLDASDEGGAFLRRGPLVIHPHATLSTRPDYGGAAPAAQGAIGLSRAVVRRRRLITRSSKYYDQSSSCAVNFPRNVGTRFKSLRDPAPFCPLHGPLVMSQFRRRDYQGVPHVD